MPACLCCCETAADVSTVLAGMSVLLVPSVLHEAFGMVVLDAMLHGLPVIVAAAGALPEAAAGAAAAVLPVNMVSFPSTQPLPPAHDAKGTASVEESAGAAAADSAQAVEASLAAAAAGSTTAASHVESGCWACGAVDSSIHGSPCTSQPSLRCCKCWVADQRSWGHRQYACLQQEHIDSWSSAVMQVLHSREAYAAASERSRAAARSVSQQRGRQLEALLSWLQLSHTGC